MKVRIVQYSDQDVYERPYMVRSLKDLTLVQGPENSYTSGLWKDLEARRPGHYFLAYVDGAIVGWSLVSDACDWWGDKLQVAMYVDEKFRNHGIGSKLARRARELADMEALPLMSCPGDSKGRHIYAKYDIVLGYYNWS